MAHILLTIECWAIFFIQHFYKDVALGDWLLDDLFCFNCDRNSLSSGHSNDEERLCTKKASNPLLTNDRFYTTQ